MNADTNRKLALTAYVYTEVAASRMSPERGADLLFEAGIPPQGWRYAHPVGRFLRYALVLVVGAALGSVGTMVLR